MHAILPTDELRPRSKADEVRLQDEGTHTSRTIMLDELPAMLARRDGQETRRDGPRILGILEQPNRPFADSYKDLQKAYDDAIAKVRK